MTDPLTISCDEAGHTGPDLLHPEQRYFGFASIAIQDGEAWEIIQKGLRDHPVQMLELKAARLMRSARGRNLIASLLEAAEGRFAVNVHDKLLALCGWVFEYIYEPVYQDNPVLLYEKISIGSSRCLPISGFRTRAVMQSKRSGNSRTICVRVMKWRRRCCSIEFGRRSATRTESIRSSWCSGLRTVTETS